MAIRTGIDIVDIPKFAEKLKSEVFIRKVFTPAEIKICKAAADPVQCYAGKFAAKEAFMKAIGKGIRQEIWFTQIEVHKNELGAPYVQANGKARQTLSKLNVKQLQISISHTHEMAVAVILLEASKEIV